MKTQVLRLEIYDDATSIRDKMGWGHPARILLVWPTTDKPQKLFSRRFALTMLDWVLLQRRAQELGAQLGLVCEDVEARPMAESVGVPVFATVRRAQAVRWRNSRRRRPLASPRTKRPNLSEIRQSLIRSPGLRIPLWLRALAFSLAVLAFGGLIISFLPSAQILVNPRNEIQEIVFPVVANPQITNLSLKGEIPSRPITVIVAAQESITTTGSIAIASRQASGNVLFTNLTDQPQTIAEGTVVATSGDPPLRFMVAEGGELPAGPGRTLRLRVRAAGAGSRWNIPAGELQTLGGTLNFKVAVINPAPFLNGADISYPAPTSEDRIRLYAQVLKNLKSQAERQIRLIMSEGDVLTSAPMLTEILEKTYDPPLAAPASALRLTVRAQFTAQTASAQDILSLAGAFLDASLPEGYAPVGGTLETENRTQPSWDDPQPRWELRASRIIRAIIFPATVATQTRGLPPLDASQRLSAELSLAEPPIIRLSPEWWPRLPFYPMRIETIEVSGP